nr:MAG TPA: hypothetical protein [Caudoviricetes sp.]
MNNRGKEAIEAQKQLIVKLCKERYPESLDVSEIRMRTGWKINKLLIDDLVNDGIIEWDDLTTIKLNG